MRLKKLGSNQTLLITNHGAEILYSYETPVAGFSPDLGGYFKNSENYSQTTSKHVNSYLKGIDKPILMSLEEIERFFFKE